MNQDDDIAEELESYAERLDAEQERVPAGSPDGGEFGEGSSLESSSNAQIQTRLARLARSGSGSGHPEYQAIVRELKSRGIKSFGALAKSSGK